MKLLAVAALFGLFALSHATTAKNTKVSPTSAPTTTSTGTTTISTTPKETTNATTMSTPPTTGSTTTKSSISSTTAASSTPAKPTGAPRYELQNRANKTCLAIQGNINVTFPYEKKQIVAVVPRDTLPTGKCTDSAEKISFSWKEDPSMALALDLYFNKTSSDYSLTYVNFDYTITGSLAGSSYRNWGASVDDAKVKTKLNTYYNCTIGLTTKVQDVTLNLTDFLVSAFVEESGDQPLFSKPGTNCTYQGPTDAIVPIVVGAALAAMVLIVLIGYCIGRRRAANNAYQAMNNA